MQNLMSNCATWEITVFRCQKIDTFVFYLNCKFALTGSSAFILLVVENYIDVYTGAGFHFKNELLYWVSEKVQIF